MVWARIYEKSTREYCWIRLNNFGTPQCYLPNRLMCACRQSPQNQSMSSSSESLDLAVFSQSVEHLVSGAAGSVVTLKAAAYRWSSGVLLPNRFIAAANHAIRRNERIPIRTVDGSAGEGTVVGRDESIDLAIVKIDSVSASPLDHADPAALKAGALAAVVGMTPDVGPSASLGIIGAIGDARGTWRGDRLDRFIRLDVNLYPSQSGAAVVNARGQLIGMATPALSRHAARVIPATTLARLTDQVAQHGGLRHGYIGVGVQSVAIQSSLRDRLDLKQPTGLMLISVEDNSPADKAGLQLGDILLKASQQELREPEELQAVLRAAAIGNEIEMSVLHGGHLERRTATVGERPAGKK